MPGQVLAVGVTVIVATTGVVPVLVAVKEAIELPVPLEARPMEALELLHPKVVPVVVLVKFITGTVAPVHRLMLAGTVTFGLGLTVIV